jgi:hypothetical protein
LDCGLVWAFVGIFRDILDDLNTTTELNVDVTIIADREIWVIWDHPAIIHSELTAFNTLRKCYIREVTSAILRVTMLVWDRLGGEWFWEALITGFFACCSVTRGTGGL